MGIPRSSFYNWKTGLSNPSKCSKRLTEAIILFQKYHKKYPSHGYRWLNAKIHLDTDIVFSDVYAHKCCRIAGIKSEAKRCCHYTKPREHGAIYPNLLLSGMNVKGPLQCVVSDMTAFCVKKVYYELTLYMDLWNNEIISHSLSSKRGDRMTYISGLNGLVEFKKQYPEQTTILHSDRGSVYSSKNFNELLPMYNIIRSMSRAGTPTDNGAMEAINGWIKAELFKDFHVTGQSDVKREVSKYITFFNTQRAAYTLGYLTPQQYRELYSSNLNV